MAHHTFDSPEFTACVLGQAPAPALDSFQQNLEQNPLPAQEAAAILGTAARLSAALKQGPTVALTIQQRHAILQRSAPSLRPTARRPWLIPTLTTTGLAAAVALGLYLFPGTDGTSLPTELQSAIPAVALQPSSPAKPGSTPPPLPPSVATGIHQTSTLPEVPPPHSPVPASPAGTMAATAPRLQISPPAQAAAPAPDPGPAGKPQPHQTGPGESLAVPPPHQR